MHPSFRLSMRSRPLSRFEKLLVVDEVPEMTLTYRRKID